MPSRSSSRRKCGIDAAMSSGRSTRVAPDASAGQISSALVSKLIEANWSTRSPGRELVGFARRPHEGGDGAVGDDHALGAAGGAGGVDDVGGGFGVDRKAGFAGTLDPPAPSPKGEGGQEPGLSPSPWERGLGGEGPPRPSLPPCTPAAPPDTPGRSADTPPRPAARPASARSAPACARPPELRSSRVRLPRRRGAPARPGRRR